jgi:hypothetical protein
VPADEDLPDPLLSAVFPDLAGVEDGDESEPDVFASAPDGFSLAAGESPEDPFGFDPLTEVELRLSVR